MTNLEFLILNFQNLYHYDLHPHNILFKERKLITLQEVNLANTKYQKRNIILEMKRFDLKIELNKKFSTLNL